MAVILYQLTSSPWCFLIPIWEGSTRSKQVSSLFLHQSTRNACSHTRTDADMHTNNLASHNEETASTWYFLTMVLISSYSSLACLNERNFPDAKWSSCIQQNIKAWSSKMHRVWMCLIHLDSATVDQVLCKCRLCGAQHVKYVRQTELNFYLTCESLF